MNNKELEQIEEVVNTPITEDNLKPLVPIFPEKPTSGSKQ